MNPEYTKIGLHYLVNDNYPDIFANKKQQLNLLVQCMHQQIKDRKQITEHNLYAINKDICNLDTKILQFSNNQASAIYMPKFELKLIDLEKEKRDQVSLFWRDTIDLQKIIAYITLQYEKLNQKQQFI